MSHVETPPSGNEKDLPEQRSRSETPRADNIENWNCRTTISGRDNPRTIKARNHTTVSAKDSLLSRRSLLHMIQALHTGSYRYVYSLQKQERTDLFFFIALVVKPLFRLTRTSSHSTWPRIYSIHCRSSSPRSAAWTKQKSHSHGPGSRI